MDVQTRKPRRFLPLLLRKIHKWVGLILGLQLILWTISGSVMALLDMDKVGGHDAPSSAAGQTPWPSDVAAPAAPGPVDGLTMRRLLDRPVYEVRNGKAVRLLDARTGEPIVIDAALATDIARSAYRHTAMVRSATRLEKPTLEAHDHDGAMWRIDFADEDNSSSYVSAETGLPLADRSDSWRVWNFMWMLHSMDYGNRTNFNHPLIIAIAFGALWLSSTGFYLLFKSFRRSRLRRIPGG